MSFFRVSVMAAVLIGFAVGSLSADSIPTMESSSGITQSTVAPTLLLNGSTEGVATTPVTYGFWRPYWRGYYHGSAGFAPRPNFVYGPVVYPRFFGRRAVAAQPVYVASPQFASAVPCSGGPSAASTAPAIAPPQVASRPQSAATGQSDGFRNVIGQSIVVPESYVPPPSTEEPPLANAVNLNRVKSPAVAKTEGYLAYGESGSARPATTVIVDRR